MANKTVGGYSSIHGTNPQFLVEKIVRTKIYSNIYWKEKCAGLNGKNELLLCGEIICFVLK